MPTPQDDELLRFAVASGQLSEEQAEGVRAALGEVEALGGSSSAEQLLVNRELLTAAQVTRLHQAIASSKAATRVPRELGGFELLEKIGQGGMGSVFKARQKELDRVVALKVLSPRLSRNREFVERFLREARSAGKLNHPNIIAAIDVGEDQGFYYFAMEFVDGETLGAIVQREGRLPVARALAVAADVARALDHAHAKGLIHRDIKPDNVMITADGRVRVADFGLARAVDAADDGGDADRFMGTPCYVAPEQIRSEPDIDCRADLFSLGVTLFEMLTGERPFQGANPMAIAATILTAPLPSMRERRPEVSSAVARVVETLTAKDRGERYAAPADAVAALEQAASAPRSQRPARLGARPRSRPAAKPSAARRAPPRRRSSPVGAYITVAAAIAVFVGAVVYIVATRKPPPRPEPGPKAVAPPKIDGGPSAAEAAIQKQLADLKQAVADAEAFAKSTPRAYVSQIGRWAKIRDRFAKSRHQMPAEGIDLCETALKRLKATEGAAKTAAAAELKRLEAAAGAALKARKLGDAVRAVDGFPAELRIPSVADNVDRLQARTRRKAIAEFQKIDLEGQRLLKASSFAKARGLYTPLAKCPVPQIAARAKQALGEIDTRLAAQGDRAVKIARQAYPLTAKALLDHLAHRNYDPARKLLDAAVVEPKLEPVRERLRDLQPLVRGAAEMWGLAAAGIRRLKPGQPTRVAGVGGEFVRFADGRIYLEAGGAVLARTLADLRAEEAVAFAERGLGKPTPQHQVKFALFLLAEAEHKEARKRLDAAKAAGADVAAAADLLDRLAPRLCGVCKGERSATCPDCQGKGLTGVGRRPCDACKGQKKAVCPKCGGVASFTCPTCKGTGSEFKGLRCPDCNGRGKLRCPRCGGDGELTCKACRGTGIVTRPTPCARCKGRKAVTCPECGGAGEFPARDLVPPAATPAE